MLTERRIARVLAEITSSDASVRRRAAEALRDGDGRVLYPLIKALRDPNPGVQDAAMRSLITLGGEVVAYMVMPLLREDAYLRNTAIVILREIGTPSVPLIQPLLRDKDDDVRKFALDLIGDIGSCDYPQDVLRLLAEDPNPNVRASAARILGILSYRKAVPQLINSLTDDEWVCFSAMQSLSDMKEEVAIVAVESLLTSGSEAVRYAAIEALGRIGSALASDALLNHLPRATGLEHAATVKSLVQVGITPYMSEVADAVIRMFVEGDWDDRLVALKGIQDLKDDRAVYPVLDVAGSLDPSTPHDEEQLRAIKEMLLSFGCRDVFIDLLSDPALKYRGRALLIDLLGELRCSSAVPWLLSSLHSQSRDVRRSCVRALGELDGQGAQGALVESLHDEDGHIRRSAIAALGSIADPSCFSALSDLLQSEPLQDVVAELVKALLRIDATVFLARMESFDKTVRELVALHTDDADVLLELSQDESMRVRIAAISRLGGIGDERAVARLKEAVHNVQPEIRRAAIMALGERRTCPETIVAALGDDNMWVRLYAVRALACFAGGERVDHVIPMLADREIPVVLTAIDALAESGSRAAIAALETLREHAETAVREKVSRVLEMSWQPRY